MEAGYLAGYSGARGNNFIKPAVFAVAALAIGLPRCAAAGVALYSGDADAVLLDHSANGTIVTAGGVIFFSGANAGMPLPRGSGGIITGVPPGDFVYSALLPAQSLAFQPGDFFALAWNAQGGPGMLLFGIDEVSASAFVVTSNAPGTSSTPPISGDMAEALEVRLSRAGATLELAVNPGEGWQVICTLDLSNVDGANISGLPNDFGLAWRGAFQLDEIRLEGVGVPDVNQGGTHPPCGDSYGTTANRIAIEDAMLSGTASAVEAAIRAAKETRGAGVGCPDEDFARAVPSTAPVSAVAVRAVWQSVHAPRFVGYDDACPTIGREWPTAALGAYYARLAGQDGASDSVLAQIAENLEALQYTASRTAAPAPTWEGAFAYALALGTPGADCYRGGIMDTLPDYCGFLPDLCVTYTTGMWAGQTFLVGDFSILPRLYDGGMAYDQGWSGVMLIETALQHGDPSVAGRALESALLAGRWCAAEPCVRNHNYTAKTIWLLAQLYGLTGEADFKAALLDKLHRNLLPGVVTDWNEDGLVDGMANQPLGELWAGARRPGRMWDGHNSLIWYQAMNTWAVTEAYVAFRDRGDTAEAALLRPYAVIMLDNMAWELCHLGPGAVLGPGVHPIPYALLIGLWKVAAYEGEPHPDWEQAAWVIWNTGYANVSQNRTTGNVGLYLVYTSGTPYEPLAVRAGYDTPCPECPPSPSVLFEAGDSACLRAPGEFAPFAQFEWRKDGEEPLVEGRLQGVHCQTLLINVLQPSDSGTYVCIYGPESNRYEAQIEVVEVLPLGKGWMAGAFAFLMLAMRLRVAGSFRRNRAISQQTGV